MSREIVKAAARVSLVGKKYSPERLVKLLDSMLAIPVVTHACLECGISRGSIKYYIAKSQNGDAGFQNLKWRGEEAPFHEHWENAKKMGVERVEIAAFKRATGFLEPQVFQGRVQYQYDPQLIALGFQGPEAYLLDKDGKPVPETIERQSEDLQLAILRAYKPNEYTQNRKVDVHHSGGVLVVGVKKTSAELDKEYGGKREIIDDVEFVELDDDTVEKVHADRQ